MHGAAAADPAVGAPARDVAMLLARFACNNHTVCDEELQAVGTPPPPFLHPCRGAESPGLRQPMSHSAALASSESSAPSLLGVIVTGCNHDV